MRPLLFLGVVTVNSIAFFWKKRLSLMSKQIVNPYPRFSEKEYERRYGLVRKMMEEKNLEAILVFSNRANDGAVNYLSNYVSSLPTYLIFPREGKPAMSLHFFNHIPCAKT